VITSCRRRIVAFKWLAPFVFNKKHRCEVFVAPHLRRVHVPPGCVPFDGTFLENLTFGCLSPADVDRCRVEKICSRMGIERNVINMLDSSEKLTWRHLLSGTYYCEACDHFV